MANFDGLPNELLLEIWRHVLQPEDIENFAQASRKIRALSGPFLSEHRELTQKFSTFTNDGWESKVSAAGLVKEIAVKPRVALYVRKLVIIRCLRAWESELEGVNTLMAFDPEAGEDGRHYCHIPYAEKDMILFEQMVEKAQHVFGNSYDKVVRGGNEGPIIALLLLFLTNLKSLEVGQVANNFHFYMDLEHTLTAPGTKALRRLIEVKLLHYNNGRKGDIFAVKAFATIPSIKEIHCGSIAHVEPYPGIRLNLPARSSNVETLTFNCIFPNRSSATTTFLSFSKGSKD